GGENELALSTVTGATQRLIEPAVLPLSSMRLIDDHEVAPGTLLVVAVTLDQRVMGGDLDAPRVQFADLTRLDAVVTGTEVTEQRHMLLELFRPPSTHDLVGRINPHALVLTGNYPGNQRPDRRFTKPHVVSQEHAAATCEARKDVFCC